MKKSKLPEDQDYNFYSMMNEKLEMKNEFFAYVIEFDVKAVQIRNVSNKSYVLAKNFKIGHIKNYSEKKCYMVSSKERHLTIIFKNSVMRKIREKIKKNTNETKFDNEIII